MDGHYVYETFRNIVFEELVSMILFSDYISVYVNLPAIEVCILHNEINTIEFIEVTVIDDEIFFIDSNGNQYPDSCANFDDILEIS